MINNIDLKDIKPDYIKYRALVSSLAAEIREAGCLCVVSSPKDITDCIADIDYDEAIKVIATSREQFENDLRIAVMRQTSYWIDRYRADGSESDPALAPNTEAYERRVAEIKARLPHASKEEQDIEAKAETIRRFGGCLCVVWTPWDIVDWIEGIDYDEAVDVLGCYGEDFEISTETAVLHGWPSWIDRYRNDGTKSRVKHIDPALQILLALVGEQRP